MFHSFLGSIIKHPEKSQAKQRFKKFLILVIELEDTFVFISFIMLIYILQFSTINNEPLLQSIKTSY